MKLKKLSISGFAHDIALVVIVVMFAIGGTAYLVASHADSTCPVSGSVSQPTSVSVSTTLSTKCPPITYQINLYRLYNNSNGDHFYTTSYSEAVSAQQQSGYRLEVIYPMYLTTVQSAPNVLRVRTTYPIYRAYNGRDHFYTASYSEYLNAIQNIGYHGEGVAFSAVNRIGTPAAGYCYEAWYRLYSPASGDHFYTPSASEAAAAQTKAGYRLESSSAWTTLNKCAQIPG